MDNIEFKQVEHHSLPLIKQFYKKNKMRAQAPKGDLIFTATLDLRIVAALRLHPVNNVYLLRSMCVTAELRQKGIGSAFLTSLQETFASMDCYCFPFSHLESFYSHANFIHCQPTHAPHDIAQKFNRYIENGKNICLMKHHPLSP